MGKEPPSREFDPVSEENKQVADDIESSIARPSSIEEEMLLEAAELEEVEYGTPSEEPVEDD